MNSVKLANKELAQARNRSRFQCALLYGDALSTFSCIYFEAGLVYGNIDDVAGTISWDPKIIRDRTDPLLGAIANIADVDTDIHSFNSSVCSFKKIYHKYAKATIRMLNSQLQEELMLMIMCLSDFYELIQGSLEALYSYDIFAYIEYTYGIPADELSEQHSVEDTFVVAQALLKADPKEITRCMDCKYGNFDCSCVDCSCTTKIELEEDLDDGIIDSFDNRTPTKCAFFEPAYLRRIK